MTVVLVSIVVAGVAVLTALLFCAVLDLATQGMAGIGFWEGM